MVGVAPLGQIEHWHFHSASMPQRASRSDVSVRPPLEPIPPPRVRSHALTGHCIPARGANPGNLPGKRNPRSEGTPHSLRVSDIDPGTPYAVFLQNTPILWDAVPRAMPWAGMRYPFRVYGTITFSDTVFDRCGLGATCGNRGQRTRLQWRRARLTERFSDGERTAQDEAAGERWRAWRAIASS